MKAQNNYQRIEIVPGMVTAGEVRTKGGQLIVENGVSLTDRLISALNFMRSRRYRSQKIQFLPQKKRNKSKFLPML